MNSFQRDVLAPSNFSLQSYFAESSRNHQPGSCLNDHKFVPRPQHQVGLKKWATFFPSV